MPDPHNSPIKTPKQLITLIVLAFVIPITVIVLLTQFVAGAKREGEGSSSMTPEAIADRLKPVGSVQLAAASGPRALQSGEAVYKLACSACHATGAAGAPKAGDTAAWGPRIKEGFDTLVKHAVEGFKGMPPKGGNASLDPIEVARGVAYMANQAGAKFTEPAAPAAGAQKVAAIDGGAIVEKVCSNCHETGKNGAPVIGDRAAWAKRASKGLDAVTLAAVRGHDGMPARGGMASLTDAEFKAAVMYMFNAAQPTAAAAPAAAPVAAAAAPAAASAAGAGEALYKQVCMACHATGAAGAPKTGDKAAWAPRIKQGIDALTQSALKGKGAMPPKGGSSASDAEVRAAVEYLVSQAK